MRRSLHIGKTHDEHQEACPPARQGTILNSYQVSGNAIITSMVLNLIMMTADLGVADAV